MKRNLILEERNYGEKKKRKYLGAVLSWPSLKQAARESNNNNNTGNRLANIWHFIQIMREREEQEEMSCSRDEGREAGRLGCGCSLSRQLNWLDTFQVCE